MKKKALILLIAIASAVTGIGQVNCNNPLSKTDFTKQLNQLSDVLNGKIKLQRATKIVKTYCVTTKQVTAFSKLFSNDQNRLGFLEAAYDNVSDKKDFYSVFDTFSHFSFAFRLYDFIQAKKAPQTTFTATSSMPDFPKYTYPKSSDYKGPSACNKPLAKNDFNTLVQQVYMQNNATTRLAIATNISAKNCLSTAQAMKITSLLKNDADKSTFLKAMWQHIYDQNNYGAAAQLLADKDQQKNFSTWVQNMQGSGNSNKNNTCEVTAAAYDTLKATIKKIDFVEKKKGTAEDIIKKNKCFTAVQIKGIVALFDFDKTKLSIAKFAYDYCSDKENYYLVGDAFTFSAAKNELINYINKHK